MTVSAPSPLWRNCCLYERAQDWVENWLIHSWGVITRNQLCQWLQPVTSMEIFFPGLKRLWLLSISRLFYNMWYCKGVLFFLWDQIQEAISSLLPNNAKLLEDMLLTRQNSSLWQSNALEIGVLVCNTSNFRTSYEHSCTFFPICIYAFQINGLPNKTSQYFYFHTRFFSLPSTLTTD